MWLRDSVTAAWYLSNIRCCWLLPLSNGVWDRRRQCIFLLMLLEAFSPSWEGLLPSSCLVISLNFKMRCMDQNCPSESTDSEWPQLTCRPWHIRTNYCCFKSLNSTLVTYAAWLRQWLTERVSFSITTFLVDSMSFEISGLYSGPNWFGAGNKTELSWEQI